LDAPNSTAVVVQWQVGYHVTCAVHHMTNSNIDIVPCLPGMSQLVIELFNTIYNFQPDNSML